MSFLEVKDFRKDFGAVQVLKGVDFSLEKGEVLAIIGSSGSGKTTLLRCMNFLETPDNGIMTVNDKTILSINKADYEIEKKDKPTTGKIPNVFWLNAQKRHENKKLQRKIFRDFVKKEKENLQNRLQFGLVFQSFNLFPHYNVFKNILVPSEIQNARILDSYKKELKSDEKFVKGSAEFKTLINAKMKALEEEAILNADRLLAKVGLSDKKLNYPCELSGGQQQRVAIARALALSPNILCFDEPTSALDPELTGEVLKVIKGLKNSEMTMIVVTHEMDFAKNVADKIIFMQDGIIEEQGSPEQIFGNPQTESLRAFLQKSEETI